MGWWKITDGPNCVRLPVYTGNDPDDRYAGTWPVDLISDLFQRIADLISIPYYDLCGMMGTGHIVVLSRDNMWGILHCKIPIDLGVHAEVIKKWAVRAMNDVDGAYITAWGRHPYIEEIRACFDHVVDPIIDYKC